MRATKAENDGFWKCIVLRMKKLALTLLALSFLAPLVPAASAENNPYIVRVSHPRHCWWDGHHHRHCR
jgi:hypothetical protein